MKIYTPQDVLDNLADAIVEMMAEEQPLSVQKKEWPLQGKYKFQGLNICVENKKGSIRSGKEPSGKAWSITMPFDYGYIASTSGSDGDEVDCFIGPDKKSTHVFIVHQKANKPGLPAYDEDKCFLGWSSPDAAKRAYHSAYNNVDLFHSMTMMPLAEFKQKLKTLSGKKLHASLQAGGPGSGRYPKGSGNVHEAIEDWAGVDQDPKKLNSIMQEVLDGKQTEDANTLRNMAKEAQAAFATQGDTIPLYRVELGTNSVRQDSVLRSYALTEAAAKEYLRGYEDSFGKKLDGAKILKKYIVRQQIVAYYKQSQGFVASEKEVIVSKKPFSLEVKAGGPGSGRHKELLSKINNLPDTKELRRKVGGVGFGKLPQSVLKYHTSMLQNFVRDNGQLSSKKIGSVIVDPKTLYTEQGELDKQTLLKYANNANVKSDVKGVKIGDNIHLINGNHRATVAALAGKTIKVNLYAPAKDVKAGGPGSGPRPAFAKKLVDNFRREIHHSAIEKNRKKLTAMLQHTLPGGSLEKYHPGNITVYRGESKHDQSGGARSLDSKRHGTSWTTSKSEARNFSLGKGVKLLHMTLTKDIPAISYDKLFKGDNNNPFPDEKEVFVGPTNSIQAGGPGSGRHPSYKIHDFNGQPAYRNAFYNKPPRDIYDNQHVVNLAIGKTWNDPTTRKRIKLEDIVPRQAYTRQKLVDAIAEKGLNNKQLPTIAKFQGKLWIADGHHRIAGAIKRGDKTILVNYRDIHLKVIKAGGPGSGRHPWGRKAKPSKELTRLKNRATILQKHKKGNADYLHKLYQKQQEQNKVEGKNSRGREIFSTKQKIAQKNVVLVKKEQQDLAEKGEVLVANALSKLGGTQSRNNSPLDVTFKMPNGKTVGLEVKSMMLQKQDRIYSKGRALQRKQQWGKDNKASIGIVALDFRNNQSKPDVYYRSGIGSFTISTMEPVQGGLKGLASALGGK